MALTKMTKKNIFNDMAPTWHQRGQFEHKFERVVRCYNFFFKRAILTQNFRSWPQTKGSYQQPSQKTNGQHEQPNKKDLKVFLLETLKKTST